MHERYFGLGVEQWHMVYKKTVYAHSLGILLLHCHLHKDHMKHLLEDMLPEHNAFKMMECLIRMLTAFWSGFSPLIFPAWLYLPEAHMPPPA